MNATFVVIGGGIAGVSCAESLAILEPDEPIILVSESALIKTVTNLYAITKTLSHFDVAETPGNSLSDKYHNITVIYDSLVHIESKNHEITTRCNKKIKYNMLCLCMGGEPKLISQSSQTSRILGIRDTDSVENFLEKLSDSRTVVVVGNGGIASELVHKLENVETHWVIKDSHISSTFVDPGAADFLQDSLFSQKSVTEALVMKRLRYTEETVRKSGAALGPDWYKNLDIKGKLNIFPKARIHFETEVKDVKEEGDRLTVILNNGDRITSDLIISATGITAFSDYTCDVSLDKTLDGFLNVNEYMQTSIPDIYAAGDIVNANWPLAKHWFQMKLWTQARQMGCYGAKSMSGHFRKEEVLQDFCFELFAHSTKLFGHKVILLGLFNGQKLGTNYEILLRTTKKMEYVKFVLEDNRLQGAVLIGDTDLEEMCENLILNQLDLSPYGDDILNPDIDIEDYFD